MSRITSLNGRSLISGAAQGPLLFADMGLSFWGGVNPFTGEVIRPSPPPQWPIAQRPDTGDSQWSRLLYRQQCADGADQQWPCPRRTGAG